MILTIRVEESVGKALKALAEADERKLSAYVARLLRRHVDDADANGPKTPKRK